MVNYFICLLTVLELDVTVTGLVAGGHVHDLYSHHLPELPKIFLHILRINACRQFVDEYLVITVKRLHSQGFPVNQEGLLLSQRMGWIGGRGTNLCGELNIRGYPMGS